MEIAKNKTQLNSKALWSFQSYLLWKNLWVILLASVVVILCAFRAKNGAFVLDSLWVLIVGACCTPIYIIFALISFAISNKKFKAVDLTYTFMDDKIVVEGISENAKENTILTFGQITKVRETSKYVFMYINKGSALLVDKKGFESGDADKVKTLLQINIDKRKEEIRNKKKGVK